MKTIISILIGTIAILIALLKNKGFFDIGIVYLFGVEDLRGINLSFIKLVVDKIFYIPDLIFNITKDKLAIYLPENYFLSKNFINLYIIGIFYFIFMYISLFCISFFSFNRDKIYLFLLIFLSYGLLIYMM